jgi:hypothetical protein
LVALSEKLLLVEQDPHQYPVRYGTIRAVQLHRFPYLVYYRIAGQTVRMLAVLPAKRDPERQASVVESLAVSTPTSVSLRQGQNEAVNARMDSSSGQNAGVTR